MIRESNNKNQVIEREREKRDEVKKTGRTGKVKPGDRRGKEDR